MKIPSIGRFNRIKPALIRSVAGSFSLIVCVFLWNTMLDSAADKRDALLVSAYLVDTRDVVRVFGQLHPRLSNTVTTDTRGKVVSLYAKPGMHVKSGQLLVELRNPAVEREFSQLEIELMAEQVKFKSTVAAAKQSEIEQKNQIAFAKSEWQLLETELVATTALYERGIVSQLRHEQIKAGVTKARIKLTTEQSKLEAIVETNQVKIALAKAQIQLAEQRKRFVEQQLAALHVKSDVAGIVTLTNEGLAIGASVDEAEFIAQVSAVDDMYARLSVTASNAQNITRGKSAVLHISGEEVLATVTRVSPYVVENQIEFDANLEGVVPQGAMPNMNISGEVVVNEQDTLVGLPKLPHVSKTQSQYWLYVFDKVANELKLRQVTISSFTDSEMFVSEGLEEGEIVLFASPEEYGSRAAIKYDEIKT